jgi:hypothetical protein
MGKTSVVTPHIEAVCRLRDLMLAAAESMLRAPRAADQIREVAGRVAKRPDRVEGMVTADADVRMLILLIEQAGGKPPKLKDRPMVQDAVATHAG